jgi:hypothetical protein
MSAYGAYGLRIESDVPIPELPPATVETRPAAFRLAARPLEEPERWREHASLPGGEPWLSCGVAGKRVLLRFHGRADFFVAPGTLDIEGRPAPGAPLESVRHLLLDHVLPRALAAAGTPTLHASAVATPKGAIVFAGESGSGKSTLAASFCASGARLLSDDCAVLGKGGEVIPGYPVHRLWPSALAALAAGAPGDATAKRRVAPASATWDPAPAPLAAIFFLAPHDPALPWLTREKKSEAIIALVRQSFRLDPSDLKRASDEFRIFGELAEKSPVWRLAHPRRIEELDEVRVEIMRRL